MLSWSNIVKFSQVSHNWDTDLWETPYNKGGGVGSQGPETA